MSEQPVAVQNQDPNKYPHDEEEAKIEQEIKDAIKKLPLEQRLQVIALNHYLLAKKQTELLEGKKIEEISKKCHQAQEPILQKINQIIAGDRAPAQEEIEEAKTHLAAEEVNKIQESLEATPFPDYWFTVMKNCIRFEQDIFEVDHPLLKKITKIENIPEEGTLNFTIVFHFAPNDYFENTTLSAKFFLANEEIPEKVEGTEIKWKEGKDITKKTITKRKKIKKTGKHEKVTKTVDADSFFHFFDSYNGSGEDDKDDEGDEEGMGGLNKLNIKYDIANTVNEEILLYHLEYYLGLRKGDEDADGMGGYDDDLDDEDEEDMGAKIAAIMKNKAALKKK